MSGRVRIVLSLALVAVAALVVPVAATASSAPARSYPHFRSLYIRMPDGVRLAADVWLPAGTTAASRLPTVLETDRCWRARAYSGGIKNNPSYNTQTAGRTSRPARGAVRQADRANRARSGHRHGIPLTRK
jgi:predicted acyl esterase